MPTPLDLSSQPQIVTFASRYPKALALDLPSQPQIATFASRYPRVLALDLPDQPQAGAFASRYPKALALGLPMRPKIGALAPGVRLPVPAKTTSPSLSSTRFERHKLFLSLALASTLITSCAPPKPIPKTTTHTT